MEQWKEVAGYEGLYIVSDTGNVKRLQSVVRSKTTRTGSHKRTVIETTVKPHDSFGYNRVTLSKTGVNVKIFVHRIVATAFIDNPLSKPCVNHKNGNKVDNQVDNLEWCTHSENEMHSRNILGKKHLGELRRKPVMLNGYHRFNSIAEAAKLLNCSTQLISKNLRGISKLTKLGTWEYC